MKGVLLQRLAQAQFANSISVAPQGALQRKAARCEHLAATLHPDLQRSADCFHFGVLLQHFVAHLAAPSGLLVSTVPARS
jgi:hypothetical protein